MNDTEKERLQKLLKYEEEAYQKGYTCIAGLDEAGRGPLAGPLVACACIIQKEIFIPYVNDSKKLTPKKRAQVFQNLISHAGVCYAIGIVNVEEIDRINIHQATFSAMRQALGNLRLIPDYLLIDGFSLPNSAISCMKIIKGDQLSQSIAAASILAKETRDQLMLAYHDQWPMYGFNEHKGYGTAKHLAALNLYGPCPLHRRSFEPLKSLFNIKTLK